MDFRELIGLNIEWHIRSGEERERDCSWILHTFQDTTTICYHCVTSLIRVTSTTLSSQ